MKDVIIKKTNSSLVAAVGILLLLIFIAAMKHPSKESSNPRTYLALGDSYTIGEQVAAKDNFPSQVVSMLSQDGISFQMPDIIAKTGWTTDELQQAIAKAAIHERYDFVTLLIGVNNQYRGRQVSTYIPDFEMLLKEAIGFAGNDTSHVIVLSIPDWGVTPFAKDRDRGQVAAEIDAYNTANRLVAKKYNVHYINITPGSRQASADLSLVAPDGLHPSAKEYSKWAQRVAEIIKKSL